MIIFLILSVCSEKRQDILPSSTKRGFGKYKSDKYNNIEKVLFMWRNEIINSTFLLYL